ncbi:hypothetical protein ACIBCT_03025 [Streptosporangium sp. NPDC050855]|uniref:hypothetical protein n=1 Tax=Streptosporangium sp. NPDC050855 TaxID=3366194 RepID=UPI00379A1E54
MASHAARPPGSRRLRRARARRPRRLAGPVLATLIAVLLAVAFWVGTDLRDAQAAADDRQAAMRAAGTHAVHLLSVGHRAVDADIGRVLATSTGAARAEYARAAAELKRTTVAGRLLRTGALRATGLVSLRGGTARVMVVGDELTRRDGGEDVPQERFHRWDMEVTKVGTAWLVSKVEPVP